VRHAEDISLRIRAYAEGQRRDPQELLDDLDEHVGDEGKFVNRSDAIRASIRKTLDMLDEIDERHGRVETDEAESH